MDVEPTAGERETDGLVVWFGNSGARARRLLHGSVVVCPGTKARNIGRIVMLKDNGKRTDMRGCDDSRGLTIAGDKDNRDSSSGEGVYRRIRIGTR